jgi:chemotaxis protein methyltransferase CheR
MKEYSHNYFQAGGTRSLSDYFVAKHDLVLFDRGFTDHLVWAQHNLATDSSFKEFHVIFCRNVMIYFNRTLSNRVHRLLYDSLIQDGHLVLGRREAIHSSPYAAHYDQGHERLKVFRKVR